MLKDNLLLQYLFSEKRGQPDEPEIVLMLNPNIEGALPNLSLDVPSPKTGRIWCTVPSWSFTEKPDAATALVARLKRQYDVVFIEQFARIRTFCLCGVGCVADREGRKATRAATPRGGFPAFSAGKAAEGQSEGEAVVPYVHCARQQLI